MAIFARNLRYPALAFPLICTAYILTIGARLDTFTQNTGALLQPLA